jgi:membrane protein implicated in regulation of membrane protease activity
MSPLLSIYIACTIFGIGVTAIDMLGLFGDIFEAEEGGGDGGHGDDGGGFDTADNGYGDDGGGFEAADSGHGDDGGGHGDDDAGFEAEHGEHGGEHHGDEHEYLTSHDHDQARHILPWLLSTARSAVHFSVGFGSVGTFALLTGRAPGASLLWSVPIGAVTLAGGRVLRRIQRSELDSQYKSEDLIMERGAVLVSIGKGQLGKVRIQLEGTYADRYARASDAAKRLRAGTPVRVVDVTDECVYVEEEPSR